MTGVQTCALPICFLVLPHPEVAEYERRKTADRDRWLAGMRRLRAAILTDPNLRGLD